MSRKFGVRDTIKDSDSNPVKQRRQPGPPGEPDGSTEAEAGEVRPADSSAAAAAVFAAGPDDADMFETLRQRNVEQGILTDFGRGQGCAAFQPCPFYGRFMGEIAYTLNDALRRVEGLTSYYVVDATARCYGATTWN